MDCEFGYKNNQGELRIDQPQEKIFDYTSEPQKVYAGFAHGKGSETFFPSYARCFDILGQTKYLYHIIYDHITT